MSPQGSCGSSTQKRKAESLERPAQRARLEPENVQGSPNREGELISLPDEPLCTILSFFTNTSTGVVIREPHTAFALAKAHPRLLRVFTSLLTHVTTDANFLGPLYVLLVEPKDLLEFTEAGGKALRNLHLDSLRCGHLRDLSRFCPRLEAFSVSKTHDCEGCCDTLQNILGINLRSLTIPGVSEKILRTIQTPPPELSITQVSEYSEELEHVLERTSKKLTLEFRVSTSFSRFLRSIESRISSLFELCSRVEAVSVSLSRNEEIPSGWEELWIPFLNGHIRSVKQNDGKSLCKSIKLSGLPFFHMIQHVHPSAYVELTEGEVTFVNGEDGLYAKKIRLLTCFRPANVSRLEEVVIEDNSDKAWKNLLSGKKIARGLVRSMSMAAFLRLDLDVVYIESWFIKGNKWRWLRGARELHILTRPKYPSSTNSTIPLLLLNALPSLIDSFAGYMIWVHDLGANRYPAPLPVQGEEKVAKMSLDSQATKASYIGILRRGWKGSISAVGRFERRGGNGEMVMNLLKDVRNFMITEYGVEIGTGESPPS